MEERIHPVKYLTKSTGLQNDVSWIDRHCDNENYLFNRVKDKGRRIKEVIRDKGLVISKAHGAVRMAQSDTTNRQVEINNRQVRTDSLKVFGNDYGTRDGTCVRDYIHVIDLARAHILALENLDRHPNGKYNLGNGQGFTVLEVIETAKRVTGIDIPYEFAPRRAGDPAVLVASSELAKKELGWKPKYNNLETIVSTAWEWHRGHPEGYETLNDER